MEKPSSTICAEALHTFGPDVQMCQATEECAELILEINKLRRGIGSVQDVAGELADVSIMLEQLAMMFPGMQELRRQKLARLDMRVRQARAELMGHPRVDTI